MGVASAATSRPTQAAETRSSSALQATASTLPNGRPAGDPRQIGAPRFQAPRARRRVHEQDGGTAGPRHRPTVAGRPGPRCHRKRPAADPRRHPPTSMPAAGRAGAPASGTGRRCPRRDRARVAAAATPRQAGRRAPHCARPRRTVRAARATPPGSVRSWESGAASASANSPALAAGPSLAFFLPHIPTLLRQGGLRGLGGPAFGEQPPEVARIEDQPAQRLRQRGHVVRLAHHAALPASPARPPRRRR